MKALKPRTIWRRNSKESLSISLAEMSHDIEALKPTSRLIYYVRDFEHWFIPDILGKIGGSATMVDFVNLHAPPNTQRIFSILEIRG
jgi:hypothetical protein